MKNKNTIQIVRNYRIKQVLIGVAYAVGIVLMIFLMTKIMFVGIVGMIILAGSIKMVYDKLREDDLESVIYDELDAEKFSKFLLLGLFQKSKKHQILAAMSTGDHEKVLDLVEELEPKTDHPLQKCNNLYRKGYVYFEQGNFEGLYKVVRDFKTLKNSNPKISGIFSSFTVFDKFDAMLDDDYQYVIDVCDIDLQEINPKSQNYKITKLNVSFYRAYSYYKIGNYDEARRGFEEIIEFAPKMYKAKLAQDYLDLIDSEQNK